MVLGRTESAVGIFGDALEIAGSDRGLPQHVMVAGHDDVVVRRFDLGLPPCKRLLGDGAGRGRAAGWLAPDRVGQVVAVTRHQEADVSNLERVALPGSGDRIGPLGVIDSRGGGMLAERIGPFAKPPIGFLALAGRRTERRGVMIAGDVVDLLAAVLLQYGILADDLAPLLI